MKKLTILILLLAAAAVLPAQAQNSSFFIGGGGGGNLSMYGFTSDYADRWTSSKPKPGLNGGVVFGMEFNRMAIVTGANFIQKGSKAETDNYRIEGNYVGYVKGRENTSFIQIPLLFRFRILGEKFGLTASAGPSFNIGLSGNSRLELEVAGVGSRSESGTIKFGSGINDSYKRFQPGFMLGPGMMMAVGEKGKLNLNLMWDLGFNAVNSRSSSAAGIDGKISNVSMILNVTYTHHFIFGDKY
ncbi:Outer membrane protein beta-barrel domain-containing protein [Dyadobacter soli]|uniref:Outer membrane protein beta-barrel domain-containing protein n=1 Tax=Dyadobacter soli TaxID=659014 RepID=A0A1G7CUY7_9BACT|nr:porin family protein [Dyadobacter soli]SDE43119.1 Outer membrane protein beta-barrel domain-containing protein [Dyadobacter soli]